MIKSFHPPPETKDQVLSVTKPSLSIKISCNPWIRTKYKGSLIYWNSIKCEPQGSSSFRIGHKLNYPGGDIIFVNSPNQKAQEIYEYASTTIWSRINLIRLRLVHSQCSRNYVFVGSVCHYNCPSILLDSSYLEPN